MDDNKVLISVVCVTYNHEKFISQAIDSFLAQRTSFLFEIVIHDDASTDRTIEIINSYKKKYPDVIKVIHQSVNQFSEGNRVYPIAFNYCKGEYFALCDGDDYWVSRDKLQIQVEALKKYADVDLCFSRAFNLLPSGKLKNFSSALKNLYFSDFANLLSGKKRISQKKNSEGDIHIPIEEIIERGGEYAHTGSLLIRSSALNNLPDFIKTAPVSDYYLQILTSVRGGAIYLNRSMSVYRKYSSESSWSTSMRIYEKRKEWFDKTIRTNMLLNNYLDHKFSRSFNFINSSCYCHMSFFYLKNGMFKEYSNLITESRKFDKSSDKVFCLILYYMKPFYLLFQYLIGFFEKLRKTN